MTVYIASSNSKAIVWYNASTLDHIGTLPTDNTPTSAVVSPDGNFLFATTRPPLSGELLYFSRDTNTGDIALIGKITHDDLLNGTKQPLNGCYSVAASENFVYVAR